MKDFLGTEIKVGDEVLSNDIHYRSFVKGVVAKITSKTILIKVKKSESKYSDGATRRYPSQVVVVSRLLKALSNETII